MKPLTEEKYLSLVDSEDTNKVSFTKRDLNSLNQSFTYTLVNKKTTFKVKRKGNELNCRILDSNIEILKFKNNLLVEIVTPSNKGYHTFYYKFKNIKSIMDNMMDLISHII